METFNSLIDPIIVGFQALISAGITLKSVLVLMKAQAGEVNIKQAGDKVKKNILVGALAITFPEIINIIKNNIFYRSGSNVTWATSNVIAGSVILINSISKILILIEIPVAIIMFVWNGYKYMNAEEEEKGMYLKQIGLIIVLAAIIVTLTASIPAILKIFK